MGVEKSISLLYGYEKGWEWQIFTHVQRSGVFHNKSKIHVHKNYNDKQRIRRTDNIWFKRIDK